MQAPPLASQSLYLQNGWEESPGLAGPREGALIKPVSWELPCGTAETNLTGIHEGVGLIPGIAQWVKDLALLWCRSLGSRVAVAVAMA